MKFCVLEKTPETLVLAAALTGDNPAFSGHFPEVALLPGVVQVDWAIAQQPWYCAEAFRRIDKLKFMQITPPGIDVTLTLRRSAPGHVVFEYACGEHLLSSGVLVFAEPPGGVAM